MRTQPTVALLCGGISPEHEVSIRSAKNIFKAIDKSRWQVEIIGIGRDGSWRHLPVQRTPHGEAEFPKLDSVEGNEGLPLHLAPGTERVIRYAPPNHESRFTVHGSPVTSHQSPVTSHQFPQIDVVFPILHGPFGEDGTMQGLLQVLGLPFVGPDALGSAVGMDKDFTKRILNEAGIPNAPWVTLMKHEVPDFQSVVDKLGFPMFVKPANMGSSVGVSKAEDLAALKTAVELAFRFDKKVLVEQGIRGREIETAVLGNLGKVEVSGVGEIVMADGFYDYESKYISADAAKTIIPAEGISDGALGKIRQTALRTYHALGLEGMARLDVFLTADGEVFVNEPNTLPGFTNISMYPKLWEAAGLPYGKLIDRLLELALERHERDGALRRVK